MTEIKLSYFDVRGRAETSRLILAYAGVRYTDQRLSGEQFGSVKAKLPWGQLPTLKYNGTMITQSMSIARFLANEFGLAGKTPLESAQADEVVDAITDLVNARLAATIEPEEAMNSEKMRTFLEVTLPKNLERFEKLMVERGGQFMVGNRLSWADLHLFALVDGIQKSNPEVLAPYTGLASLVTRIVTLPNIANWLAARPNTVM